MPPAVWMFLGVMVALTVLPVAITVGDVVKCRKNNEVITGNGQRNTHSSLRLQNISKRVHIVQHGLGDHHEEWAASAPTLRTVSEAKGRTHHVVGMRPVL